MLKDDIIEPSVSPYNAPLLLVPKKNTEDKRKWRLVVDFRKLNNKIVNDKFPLTRLEDILDKLGRAKWFSTLDMTSSFHQIQLDKNSRPLTAFSTQQGHYQFKRLPFGLKISSNSFQRMLTIALSGLDSEAFLYVDDIIVYGCSLNHHNQNLIKVLDRLQQYNLKLNPKKCCFLRPEVVYLGHLITKDGVRTDPAKYEVIKNYPIPKDADEVRRFIAFCNYYRKFIPNFADIAKDLNALLKKSARFIWTNECQIAFDTLKEKLMKPPILQYPNFEKEFILTTDASHYALGAVLSQGEIGKDLPISYASKSLQKHDLNKPIIEKELLAIHWGINFFKPYLYGRKFTVITDHRPLISLFSHKNPSSKMTRIRLDLSDYDFTIIYKKGKCNTNADALSRIQLDSDILKQMIPLENDDKEKKILITTRAMKRNNEAKEINNENDIDNMKNKDKNENNNASMNNNDMETSRSQKPDQLLIWDCTSINDVKKMKKLKFNEINDIEENDIFIENNIVHIGRDDNSSKPVSTMKKSHARNENKENLKYKENNSMHTGFSDNSAKLDSILKKLISKMKKERIYELALPNDDKIFKEYAKEDFKEAYARIQRNNESPQLRILIYIAPKKITDDILKYKLINEFHNATHSGHLGIRKTIIKLKQRYIWKNMSRMVKQFIKHCDKCNKNKQTKHIKEPLTLTNTPNDSFQVVSIDTVGPLRISNGYRYILTMQCELTKFVVAHPISSKDALTTAKTLVEQFILKYGQFKTLKSDRGTEFTNELMRNMCSLLKTEHITRQ